MVDTSSLQEIVVFRNDTVERLCKSAVHVPAKLEELGEQVCWLGYGKIGRQIDATRFQTAKTITSNAHLCPLPIAYQVRQWFRVASSVGNGKHILASVLVARLPAATAPTARCARDGGPIRELRFCAGMR